MGAAPFRCKSDSSLDLASCSRPRSSVLLLYCMRVSYCLLALLSSGLTCAASFNLVGWVHCTHDAAMTTCRR